MDPVSAAASIIAIIEVVAKVSMAATSFMRDVKDARGQMIQVKKELSGLQTVLEVIANDLKDETLTQRPFKFGMTQSLHQQIVGIARSCQLVVTEISDVIQGQGRSRVAWVASGRARVEKLRKTLQTHMSSLDIAVDMISMIIVRGIKEDTEHILGDTSAIRQDTTAILVKIDNVQQQIRSNSNALDESEKPSDIMLHRYLDELKTDAETVLDNIDYQQEDPRPESQPTARVSTSPSTPAPILFKNTQGRLFSVPFESCRTWTEMSDIIKLSYTNTKDSKSIKEGQYDLFGPNGQIILPVLWDKLVSPGLEISMATWEKPEPEQILTPIRFKDAVGRKFSFPFHLCRTWESMEELIKQAFIHIDVIGPHVQEGHYDLIGPNGEIMLPGVWEKLIEPDMSITMCMWPLDRPPGVFTRGPPPPPPYGPLIRGPSPSGSLARGPPPLPDRLTRGPPSTLGGYGQPPVGAQVALLPASSFRRSPPCLPVTSGPSRGNPSSDAIRMGGHSNSGKEKTRNKKKIAFLTVA